MFVCGVAAGLLARAQSESSMTPSPLEQNRLLDAVRQYAGDYISNLPNFLCVQKIQQFEAGRKLGHWRKSDTLAFRLTFNHGREDHSLERVNDKPIRPGQAGWRTPLTTEGEFGLLISRVFAPESETSFVWSGWEMIQKKRVAVFSYSIAREHSSLKLTLGDIGHAIVPYYGFVYADPSSGAIWRITSTASEIPPEIRTKSISTTIDYDEVFIGPQPYLLPVRANVQLATSSANMRNEIQFEEYRKFETDSTITYTSGTEDGTDRDTDRAARAARPPERF